MVEGNGDVDEFNHGSSDDHRELEGYYCIKIFEGLMGEVNLLLER